MPGANGIRESTWIHFGVSVITQRPDTTVQVGPELGLKYKDLSEQLKKSVCRLRNVLSLLGILFHEHI